MSTIALKNFIDGDWLPGSGASLDDINPTRSDEIVASGAMATLAEVDAAVAAAKGAFPAWRDLPATHRSTILSTAARVLEDHSEEWGTELSIEEGKTLAEGIGEVLRAAEILRFYSGEPLRPTGEVFASGRAHESIIAERIPLGVISVITPFNFPIAIPAWKIAPALAYGNTVVWKPAESVPLLAMRFAMALEEAGLPRGVLNLVMGSADVGTRLVEHADVAAVTFTGSTVVGRAVIASCGRLCKPVQAEMGGVNPAVVLRGANLREAAGMVIQGAFGATGQKCSATSRLVLHDSIADEFLDQIIEQVANWRVGDPLDPAIDMGPVISARAMSIINSDIEEGISAGAQVLTGAEPVATPDLKHGFFVAPTILEIKNPDVSLWTHEIFGPALTAIRASTVDEAFAMANTGPFGLTASVFTTDLGLVSRATRAINAGVVHINSETSGADPHVPFGGNGNSGFGPKEQGRSAREFFTTTRTIYLRPF